MPNTLVDERKKWRERQEGHFKASNTSFAALSCKTEARGSVQSILLPQEDLSMQVP